MLHSVSWKLFHSPSSKEWADVHVLVELLFSLPASNRKLERVFLIAGTIKMKERSLLTNEPLDDLLLLNADKTPLKLFDPNPSIDLWWSAKTRRPSQKPRKQYKKCRSGLSASRAADSEETEDSEPDVLGDWDDLINSGD